MAAGFSLAKYWTIWKSWRPSRHAHLAADHLVGAASRIDDTFLTQKQKPQLVRLS